MPYAAGYMGYYTYGGCTDYPYTYSYPANNRYVYPVPMPSAYPPYMYGYPYAASMQPAQAPSPMAGYLPSNQMMPMPAPQSAYHRGSPAMAYRGAYGGGGYGTTGWGYRRPAYPAHPAQGSMNYAMSPWGSRCPMPRVGRRDQTSEKEKKSCRVGYWLLPPLIYKPLEKMSEAWDDPYLPPDTGMRLPSKNAYPWGYFGAKVLPQSTCYSGYYGDYFSTRTYPGY